VPLSLRKSDGHGYLLTPSQISNDKRLPHEHQQKENFHEFSPLEAMQRESQTHKPFSYSRTRIGSLSASNYIPINPNHGNN